MEFTNINDALVGLLAQIKSSGRDVVSRGFSTREIGPVQFTLQNPSQRCLVTPLRNNNIFASIAETMWVLAGRNDVEFLGHYLPRAADFSDDGVTWRGGYGPRLRDWGGTDQIDEVRKILLADRGSRRAVATIFDPAQDYVVSKDIPCNNWLNFAVRSDALNCHVAVRSNDVMWGFSGINAFEWSVLLEAMAFWVNAGVGNLTFSVTSAHIYDRHFKRADAIVARCPPRDIYSDRALSTYAFSTPWPEFAQVVSEWFAVEESIRLGTYSSVGATEFPDPLLGAFLQMVRVYWAIKSGRPASDVMEMIQPLQGSDLAQAALEYASRTVEGFPAYGYPEDRAVTGGEAAAEGSDPADREDIWAAISALHASKSLTYGDSWKRRGERIGIMANIARKVDRLQLVDASDAEIDETALDTAADLLVYAIKYATYLMDAGEMELPTRLRGVVGPLSDGHSSFDVVLDEVRSQHVGIQGFARPDHATHDVRDAYDALEQVVEGELRRSSAKADALRILIQSASRLVLALANASPESCERYLRQVVASGHGGDVGQVPAERSTRAKFFAEHNATRHFSYE